MGIQIMRGKVVLITGANRGIGKETTRALAGKGATIVMACRNLAMAQPVCEAIRKESGNPQIEVMHLDLASLSSIREFAKQFRQKYQQLNVLINNAGVFCVKREETRDGFEKTMGVNYFGHFLLTCLLLPVLEQTREARIINVSSIAHSWGRIDLSDLNFEKNYQCMKAYARSKLALVLFTQELAERLKDTDITANALYPGLVETAMWNLLPEHKWYPVILRVVKKLILISKEEGAQTSIYLASSDEVKGITGKYFCKKKAKNPSGRCKEIRLQKELWQLSEKLTGLSGAVSC
jgi:NAD(P)-dependent dehydrogenase (short-subunit alcohol dehydrogenase family)